MIKLQHSVRESIQGSLPFELDAYISSIQQAPIERPKEWDERWVSLSGQGRQELISPFLYYYDHERLVHLIHHRLSDYINRGGTDGNVLKFTENKEFSNTGDVRRVFKEILPDHLIADIYNLYYYKPAEISIGKINHTNKGKFLLLQVVNDAALKIVTAGNSIHTTIFVLEICMAIVRTILATLSHTQIKQLASHMRQVEGGEHTPQNGGFNNGHPTSPKDPDTSSPTFEELIQLLAGIELEDALVIAKKAAFVKIAELAKAGIDINLLGKDAGIPPELILEKLEDMRKDIKKMTFNTENIRHVISRIIDQSVSYFSKKVQYRDCPLWDADHFDELEDLQFLHPVFRNSQLENIMIPEARYFGKLNVYIDVSSSMNEAIMIRHPETRKVARMPALLFAKALLLKMLNMNVLAKVIPFGSDVKASILHPNELNILLLDAYCGTSIDNVILHCDQQGENALVITDCQDYIREYSSNIFIVGTPGARFYLQGGGQHLSKQQQLWLFDQDGMNIQAA